MQTKLKADEFDRIKIRNTFNKSFPTAWKWNGCDRVGGTFFLWIKQVSLSIISLIFNPILADLNDEDLGDN